MRKYQIGGLTTMPQLPAINPPQFSITNKIGPSKLPSMDFSSTTKSSGGGGFFGKMGGMGSLGNMASTVSSLIPQTEQSGLTAGLNAGYDAAANAVSAIPGVGTIIGGAMKIGGMLSDGLSAMGVGTDQMTTADKILDSKFLKLTPIGLVNALGAKKADTINKDAETFEQVGSSYTGTEGQVDAATEKSGKKYGLLSGRGRKKANAQIAEAKRKQNIVAGIADEASDAFANQRGSMDMLNTRNLLNMSGGYKQRGSYIGRNGLKLPSLEEMEKAQATVARIRQKKLAGERTIDELVQHANKSKANFVSRLNEPTIRTIPAEDGSVMSHKLGYADVDGKTIVFPQVQEIDGKLKYFKDWKDAVDSAIQRGDTLEMSPKEAELFTTQYKTKYPGFQSTKFKDGGKMNVIPDGALHAHKHHMEVEGITPKGIAVVTQEEGGVVQHAEIERNEIIFTKEVTEELERLYKDGSDEAAIQAGKLIAKQIIENTQDNTGLISEVQV
nr:MAG TPA: hypothetical protein [Bacteriophage sp.]